MGFFRSPDLPFYVLYLIFQRLICIRSVKQINKKCHWSRVIDYYDRLNTVPVEWLSYVVASVSGVTILLSLTVFLNLVAETLPQVSDAIPLLGRIAALACVCPQICLLCSGGDLCSFERFFVLCCDYFCLGFIHNFASAYVYIYK